MIPAPSLFCSGVHSQTGLAVDEDPGTKPERLGDPGQLHHADVDLGAFHVANVVAVQSGKFCQDLLTPAALGAQHAHAPANVAGERCGVEGLLFGRHLPCVFSSTEAGFAHYLEPPRY